MDPSQYMGGMMQAQVPMYGYGMGGMMPEQNMYNNLYKT